MSQPLQIRQVARLRSTTSYGVGVGVLYSNTTFIGDMGPPSQIRQVAQLMEHYMQPARVGVGVLYSISTFMREITPLLQIRQVAHLVEHHMQPSRMKLHAQEHTNNPGFRMLMSQQA